MKRFKLELGVLTVISAACLAGFLLNFHSRGGRAAMGLGVFFGGISSWWLYLFFRGRFVVTKELNVDTSCDVIELPEPDGKYEVWLFFSDPPQSDFHGTIAFHSGVGGSLSHSVIQLKDRRRGGKSQKNWPMVIKPAQIGCSQNSFRLEFRLARNRPTFPMRAVDADCTGAAVTVRVKLLSGAPRPK